MALHIYTSNRVEKLVAGLAEVVRQPLSDPFEPEIVVVQSKGMQRWLSLELARIHGVCSNYQFPFPNMMVHQLFRSVLEEVPEASPFSPEILSWRVAAILPSLLEREEFSVLRDYLSRGNRDLKLFQLSGKIADTFDQYTLFRGTLLEAWERGDETDDWQAVLWREIAADGLHRGTIRELFRKRLTAGLPGSLFPSRISVFGVSYIPAYHLEILSLVAEHTDVHIFLMSPTREYWADIVSPAAILRRSPQEREHLDFGNRLLASLGKLGKDFSTSIIEAESVALPSPDLYDEPGTATLLQQIQADILNLTETVEAGVDQLPDDSIQFHSCHSPFREVEVLHDHILHLLETLPDLQPRDILVMTPDIETYAPYISAVFEGCRDERRRIPFSIADRSLAATGPVSRLLLALLTLPDGRFSAAEVLDVLNADPVRRKFGISADDFENIRRWVDDTRIRWGIDGRQRSDMGLPEYDDNTWRVGLRRLVLGYAMPDAGELFEGILPYDHIEGEYAETLGRFLTFTDKLFGTSALLKAKRTLEGWRQLLLDIIATFIHEDDGIARELSTVREIVEGLTSIAETSGFQEEVGLEVIRAWFTERLGALQTSQAFLTGGVTFCALLPMRSIPFRVIALLGMNDGTFPRQNRAPGFDRIASDLRPGDRSLREEDRYLFLEALLSARDVFRISYVGQSIKDNADIPPSVVVSELLDTLTHRFPEIGEKEMVVRHRLQAFSPAYFCSDKRLFSYSTENFAAAVTAKVAGEGTPLVDTPTIWVPDGPVEIRLDALLRFFDNPAKHFLRERLGVKIQEVSSALADREQFDVDSLDRYFLKERLLGGILEGEKPERVMTLLKAQGSLPPGEHGEVVFHDLWGEVSAFCERIKEITNGRPCTPPLDIDLVCGDFHLTGRIDRLWDDCLLRFRCAKIKPKDYIRGWLEHLVLHAACCEVPRETKLVMLDKSCSYKACSEATEHLEGILEQVRLGMLMPLKFFPSSSFHFAEKGLDRARSAWEGDDYNDGECRDRWFSACFGKCDPLDADFEATAHAVLGPLQQYREG